MNSKDNIKITVMSFGYKYGMVCEANFVQDVRFLPNPYYEKSLKEKTGLDEKVREYVKSTPESRDYISKLKEFAEIYILKSFLSEKGSLIIAIGCTGGRHRSVTVAIELFNHLTEKGYNVEIIHRDIDKD